MCRSLSLTLSGILKFALTFCVGSTTAFFVKAHFRFCWIYILCTNILPFFIMLIRIRHVCAYLTPRIRMHVFAMTLPTLMFTHWICNSATFMSTNKQKQWVQMFLQRMCVCVGRFFVRFHFWLLIHNPISNCWLSWHCILS